MVSLALNKNELLRTYILTLTKTLTLNRGEIHDRASSLFQRRTASPLAEHITMQVNRHRNAPAFQLDLIQRLVVDDTGGIHHAIDPTTCSEIDGIPSLGICYITQTIIDGWVLERCRKGHVENQDLGALCCGPQSYLSAHA